MDRYSLPRQVSSAFALFTGLVSALVWILLARPGPGLFAPIGLTGPSLSVAVAVPLLTWSASFLVPKAFVRWMTDRNPILGATFLTLFYVYISIAVTMLILARIDAQLGSLDEALAAIKLLSTFLMQGGVFYPFAMMAYLSMLVAPLLLALMTVGAFTFDYLGQRRDYL